METVPKIRYGVKEVGAALSITIVGNLTWALLSRISPAVPPLDSKLIIIISLASFLLVTLIIVVWNSRKKSYREELLRRLGVIAFHATGEAATRDGIKDADTSYWWLGTSGFYVVCAPVSQVRTIEAKPKVEFVFITIDPQCSAAIAAQARWQDREETEIRSRIIDVRESIERLARKGIKVVWECHAAFPTFRVVIVDRKRVLVSFYERGKLGPEGEQLELDADSLLGRWFTLFFEKTREDARRVQIARKAAQLLMAKAKADKTALVEELHTEFPNEELSVIKSVVEDL